MERNRFRDRFEVLQDELLITILECVADEEKLAACHLVSKRWNDLCKYQLATLGFNCGSDVFSKIKPRAIRKQLIENKLCNIVSNRRKLLKNVVIADEEDQRLMPGQECLVYILGCISGTIEYLKLFFHWSWGRDEDDESEESSDADNGEDFAEIKPAMWKILTECHKLLVLKLSGFRITNEFQITPGKNITWPLLTRLYLGCRSLSGPQLEKILALCPNLEKLHVHGVRGSFRMKSDTLLGLTCDGEADIEAGDLEKLHFRGTRLRLSGVDHLWNLKMLCLSLNGLNLGGLRSISRLNTYFSREEDATLLLGATKNVALLKVDIVMCKSCPVGLAGIVPILRTTEALKFSFTPVADWRALHILKEDMPVLKVLKIDPWDGGYLMEDQEWIEWMTNIVARCPLLTQVVLRKPDKGDLPLLQLQQCFTRGKVGVVRHFDKRIAELLEKRNM